MIIVLKSHTRRQQVDDVKRHITDLGYEPRVIRGVEKTVIGAVGDELSHRSLETLIGLPAVETVIPIQKRYKVVTREFHEADSEVMIGDRKIGGGQFQIISGPCAVENSAQMQRVAADLTSCGIGVVRGGAYKPRTSPYDFQGLGERGLEILAQIKEDYGVSIVTEVVGTPHVERVARVADMMQIGARNCQNYNLLETVAEAGLPVLLKRGMASTVEEWLSAAEYLMVNGCHQVVLCERGIRTFEHATRSTLDVSAIAIAKQETHLPVVVDPSHAAGRADLVVPLALAGIAAGADGALIESHPDPVEALSDAPQQLVSGEFSNVVARLRPLVEAMGKTLRQ